MTDDQRIRFFKDRPLPEGWVTFSSVEATHDVANRVKLAIGRIEQKAPGAEVSCQALERLIMYLEMQG